MQITELVIIISYILILILIGRYARKITSSSSDFIVAGRKMGTVAVTASIVGLWLGGMSTVGTAEKAYNNGYFPIWFNISISIGMMIFAFTVAKLYRRYQISTIGELIEKLYNKKAARYVSYAFLIAAIILSALQLQAIGSISSQLFSIDFNKAIIVSGLVVLIYVYDGGMKSLALTNILHVGLLLSTIIIAFIIVLISAGGFDNIFSTLTDKFVSEGKTLSEATHMTANYINPFAGGYGKVLAWLVAGIFAVFATQAAIQPVFGAKDENTAKRSAVISSFLIAPLGILVATMGIAVRSGIFGILEGDKATEALPFLLMKTNLFPDWFAGLVAAGILAAILSTLAPTMFAASTIIVRDLLAIETDDGKNLKKARKFTFIIGIIIIPLAILMSGQLLETAYLTYGIRSSGAIIIISGLVFVSKSKKSLLPPLSAILAIAFATIGIIIYVVFQDYITPVIGFSPDKVYISTFFTIFGLVLGKLTYRKI